MITLSILKQMQDDGLGTIDTDLFFEEIPLDTQGNAKNGTWIVSRGVAVNRFDTDIQAFDLYTRQANKLEGMQKSKEILTYLQSSFSDLCELPDVPPYTTESYNNVRIIPTSGIDSVGSDEQDRMVFVVSGEVRYKVDNKES